MKTLASQFVVGSKLLRPLLREVCACDLSAPALRGLAERMWDRYGQIAVTEAADNAYSLLTEYSEILCSRSPDGARELHIGMDLARLNAFRNQLAAIAEAGR